MAEMARCAAESYGRGLRHVAWIVSPFVGLAQTPHNLIGTVPPPFRQFSVASHTKSPTAPVSTATTTSAANRKPRKIPAHHAARWMPSNCSGGCNDTSLSPPHTTFAREQNGQWAKHGSPPPQYIWNSLWQFIFPHVIM